MCRIVQRERPMRQMDAGENLEIEYEEKKVVEVIYNLDSSQMVTTLGVSS